LGSILGLARDLGVVFGFLSGVAFWWDRSRNRPRLVVHWHEEAARVDQEWNLAFEIENVGAVPTSLHHTIPFTAISMLGEPITGTLRLTAEHSRTLKPHEPSRFEARLERAQVRGEDGAERLSLSSFRAYRLRTTRGGEAVIRVRVWKPNTQERLSWLAFMFGRWKAAQAGKARWRQIQRGGK
jgi:hypothetical protein